MSEVSRAKWLGRTILAVSALLAIVGTGCASEDGESADSVAEEIRAQVGRFRLNPGSENLAKCAADDRTCYLRSLDVTNAYWLGAVSKAVYETKIDAAHPEQAFGAMTSEKEIIRPGKKGGLEQVGLQWREFVVFDDNLAKSTAIYFETKDGTAVLAFRGTATDQGPANVVADARFGGTCADASGESVCIHKGFRDQFYHLWSSAGNWPRYVPVTFCAAGTDNSREGFETTHCRDVPASEKVVVRVEMKDYLTKRFSTEDKPHTLFIAGHSLGGALATLALNELLLNPVLLPQNVAVYTYGTPRVGNEAFAKKMFEESRRRNIPYYRFVHRQDGVARVKLPHYAHLGRNPSMQTDGLDTFIHLVGPDERNGGTGPVMSLGHLDKQDPGGPLDLLADHGMAKYMAVLKLARL